ncbi:MAG: HspR, transcriptional repressor of DnaK operon [uncultured Campylobacterales bacterium]|uniref:HspR, transcriptional repressor of DnaK operon n=1 Tax=uncultured Campylobacterales bacterium TaxID=352960 RepID=A0A6S6ST10_9BACT|nr:MAG: HspR, transcriptional repressor of DnaK operon [uncultured Campylobacterales bacterium]
MYNEPLYLISIVAKMLTIHPQTLRQYEKEGLVNPLRTAGGIRMYSQKDVDRVIMIKKLTRNMGVNLAGVDIILRLKEELDEYENQISELKKTIAKLKNQTSTSYEITPLRRTYEVIIFGEN